MCSIFPSHTLQHISFSFLDAPSIRQPVLETESLKSSPWFRVVCRIPEATPATRRYYVRWSWTSLESDGSWTPGAGDRNISDDGRFFLQADDVKLPFGVKVSVLHTCQPSLDTREKFHLFTLANTFLRRLSKMSVYESFQISILFMYLLIHSFSKFFL